MAFKITGLNPIYFDIETTGFSGRDDDFLLAVFSYKDKYETVYNIEDLYEYMLDHLGIIVGFHTESYRGGFDIPFLRTKHITEKIDKKWPFTNKDHLDMAVIVEKFINTRIKEVKYPSKSSLKAPDLQDLAWKNSFQYENIGQAYKKLMDMVKEGKEVDWDGRDQVKAQEYNGLQETYQILFDPLLEEEYIDGGEMPKLAAQGKTSEVEKHCQNDIRRLKKVTETLIPIMPDYFIGRNIVTL